ncbi:hypothetical protein [Pseudoflavonifractor phocaeensis]|uniref:hypothetical protein n=1 Tax=Pseudoflavonifractor phocaeensis TaxID=1870988 RepID=UPI001958C586|nr:hypothetical protein [Pseudoflavonifractor phocaeensis]MBM6927301.1 hypothetical protein [Pseudoflavonifractor phocaeensis]
MTSNVAGVSHERHSHEEKRKAAYALNMCTVSVSQIVDYNDSYILEQEYDAILNNLNLKEMPKDEALLRILSELLNVITFFRIQNIKKAQIEKRYQEQLKNAIWSAIPNFSVIISGNPIAIAFSLATQIGSGYMNYRREKANAGIAKEDAEIELQITAIEQFNALKRELFTTAWRLADEYDFDDEWRLTEKQIEQYNNILLDTNEYRKYARLEAISNRFVAYPPFWYFYGHTANVIAEEARKRLQQNKKNTGEEMQAYDKDSSIAKEYGELAKNHYEHFYTLTQNHILREDQLAASCALEYVDLLWNENQPDREKIYGLLKLAEHLSPNSFDIIQLCAISYLKVGKSDDAARLLKILVNEEYNTVANAKILSRLYVSKYLSGKDSAAFAHYNILKTQVDPLYLYPMPEGLPDGNQDKLLEEKFMLTQKAILKKAYRNTLDAYAKRMIIKFNSVIPAPEDVPPERRDTYYGNTSAANAHREEAAKKILDSKAKAEYISRLKERGFRIGFTDILNETVAGIEELSCFRDLNEHDGLIRLIERRLRLARPELTLFQTKLNELNFSFEDYKKLVRNYSYPYFTEDFYGRLKTHIDDVIDAVSEYESIDKLDRELSEFCERHTLPAPEQYLHMYKETSQEPIVYSHIVSFDDELLGEKRSNQNSEKMRKHMEKIIQDNMGELIRNPDCVSIYLMDDGIAFNSYLGNDKLRIQNGYLYLVRQKAFAILDDKTKKDFDLIFCTDGIAVVDKNNIRDTVYYNDIKYSADGNTEELKLGYPDVFTNKDVNINTLNGIIIELGKYVRSLDNQYVEV